MVPYGWGSGRSAVGTVGEQGGIPLDKQEFVRFWLGLSEVAQQLRIFFCKNSMTAEDLGGCYTQGSATCQTDSIPVLVRLSSREEKSDGHQPLLLSDNSKLRKRSKTMIYSRNHSVIPLLAFIIIINGKSIQSSGIFY